MSPLQARIPIEQLEAHRRALFLVEKAIFDALAAAKHWGALSALHRINALTCCKSAEHGWPASCFSCIEILMVAHTVLRANFAHRVVLSKGHAAAAQYSLLAAEGCIDIGRLLNYKDGVRGADDALEAHADVYCDTGSLGQCLSITAGFAMAAPDDTFCVVLGDGELQEGQNYEALMSIRQHRIANLVVVVDVNGYQSEERCDAIMRIASLSTVLNGFGFDVETVDGHNVQALEASFRRVLARHDALRRRHCGDDPYRHGRVAVEVGDITTAAARWRPLVVVATTVKGGGTACMPTEVHPVTRCTVQPWHTRIPSWSLYRQIVTEQLAVAIASATAVAPRTGSSATKKGEEEEHVLALLQGLQCRWVRHCEHPTTSLPMALRTPALTSEQQRRATAMVGTGAAFGARLCYHLKTDSSIAAPAADGTALWGNKAPIAIVSADLVASCGIAQGVGHPHFFEMGVAEQNAVSFAAGLATTPDAARRLVPVVCTYSAFLKRACEQMLINLVQGAHMIYAGHYSGLCYTTDGKSHQSLNDTSLFLSMPLMCVVDPLNERHAMRCLDVAIASLRTQYAAKSQSAETAAASTPTSWYFRLRRTPIGSLDGMDDVSDGADPLQPMSLRIAGTAASTSATRPSTSPATSPLQAPPPAVILAMGSVASAVALDCVATLPGWDRTRVVYVPCLRRNGTSSIYPSTASWQRIVNIIMTDGDGGGVLTLEDDVGALYHAVCAAVCSLGQPSRLRIVGKTVPSHGPSFRCLPDALSHFGFTPTKLQQHWALGCGGTHEGVADGLAASRRQSKM